MSEIQRQSLNSKSVSDKWINPFLCSSKYLAKMRNVVIAKIKYQIDERKFIYIEVSTDDEIHYLKLK